MFCVLCVETDLENWRPNDGRCATRVARCSRAMPPLQPLSTTAALCTVRGMPPPMPVRRSWRGGCSRQGCSIWPLPWLPLALIIASSRTFSCRYIGLFFVLLLVIYFFNCCLFYRIVNL